MIANVGMSCIIPTRLVRFWSVVLGEYVGMQMNPQTEIVLWELCRGTGKNTKDCTICSLMHHSSYWRHCMHATNYIYCKQSTHSQENMTEIFGNNIDMKICVVAFTSEEILHLAWLGYLTVFSPHSNKCYWMLMAIQGQSKYWAALAFLN